MKNILSVLVENVELGTKSKPEVAPEIKVEKMETSDESGDESERRTTDQAPNAIDVKNIENNLSALDGIFDEINF